MDGRASSCSLHAEMDRLLLSVAGINSTPISYVGDLRALCIVCFVLCCENVTPEGFRTCGDLLVWSSNSVHVHQLCKSYRTPSVDSHLKLCIE